MNNTGKTLTIFLVVIAVLLVSITAIAVFFCLQEVELRESAEYNLEQVRIIESKIKADLAEAQKQVLLLEEKNKETDNIIDDLQGELDLSRGVAEEIKKEKKVLEQSLSEEKTTKESLRSQLQVEINATEEKVAALQEKLDLTVNRNKEIEQRRQELEEQNSVYRKRLEELGSLPLLDVPEAGADSSVTAGDVDLQKIVVNSSEEKKGQVISIDKETNFVIVSLGEKDGVEKNDVLSVYRNKKYLGDLRVSRVLPEMSAADFVPPLKSSKVKKADQVIIKK